MTANILPPRPLFSLQVFYGGPQNKEPPCRVRPKGSFEGKEPVNLTYNFHPRYDHTLPRLKVAYVHAKTLARTVNTKACKPKR